MPPRPLSYGSGGYNLVLPNTGRAKALRVCCWLMIATHVFTIGVQAADMALAKPIFDASDAGDMATVDSYSLPLIAASGLALLLLLGCGLAFWITLGMWIYRAVSNVRAATGDSHAGPGWSVGWWFVPFANLVVPFRVLKDLWSRSGADQRTGKESLPGIFWTLWIGSVILGVISNAIERGSEDLYGDELLRMIYVLDSVVILGSIVTIGAYYLLIGITKGVTNPSEANTLTQQMAQPHAQPHAWAPPS